jgi:hypothetical protein
VDSDPTYSQPDHLTSLVDSNDLREVVPRVHRSGLTSRDKLPDNFLFNNHGILPLTPVVFIRLLGGLTLVHKTGHKMGL